MSDQFCQSCFHVGVRSLCVFLYVFVCHMYVLCLSITALRAYWGKPLSPHLHFPWELWHSDEIQRYRMAVTPLSLALLILNRSWPFQIPELCLLCHTGSCGTHKTTYFEKRPKYLKGFYLLFLKILNALQISCRFPDLTQVCPPVTFSWSEDFFLKNMLACQRRKDRHRWKKWTTAGHDLWFEHNSWHTTKAHALFKWINMF